MFCFFEDEEEQFNSDFVIVERVLDLTDTEDGSFAYVKWRSLPYEEATWEKSDIIAKEKIDSWRARNAVDPVKLVI